MHWQPTPRSRPRTPTIWSRFRLWLGLHGPASYALVAHVIDGDSIRLVDGREVRYLSIDAPELHGRSAEGAAWAEKAKTANISLVGGRRVRLEPEADEANRDVYGRLLRQVFVGRTWVNGRLVEIGLARANVSGTVDGREHKLLKLQDQAKRKGRGMWAKQRPWWRFW